MLKIKGKTVFERGHIINKLERPRIISVNGKWVVACNVRIIDSKLLFVPMSNALNTKEEAEEIVKNWLNELINKPLDPVVKEELDKSFNEPPNVKDI